MRDEEPPIPPTLRRAALRTSTADWAWRPADLPGAVEALGAAGCAILGGEVWIVADGRIRSLLPAAGGDRPLVIAWETRPRHRGEAWSEYVRRTARETLEETRGFTDEVDAHDGEVWVQVEWDRPGDDPG